MPEVAAQDIENIKKIRENVSKFIANCGEVYDGDGMVVLDIAPQDHEGANPYFKKATIETLDIDEKAGATYTADLCKNNQDIIVSDKFDLVVCTEVLEHTLQPFDAVKEIKRILKPGGVVFVSCPFNFRIHGPLPDCWRFTEHGLRSLFSEFEILELNSLDSPDRFLMPTHYTLVARKK